MRRPPALLKLGMLALILPALYAIVITLIELRPPSEGPWTGRDIISSFERKMLPLKIAIRGQEAVGYLGDHSVPSDAEAQRNFQLTQYALAPAMVTDKRPTRYVVSVLVWSPALAAEAQRQGLTLVKDFGNEVRLFERRLP